MDQFYEGLQRLQCHDLIQRFPSLLKPCFVSSGKKITAQVSSYVYSLPITVSEVKVLFLILRFYHKTRENSANSLYSSTKKC